MNSTDASANASVPALRLSSFYFAYYAALGAFTPYWALYLKGRGQDVAAISILMSLWYATRVLAPSTWSTLAARSPRPIRWLRAGTILTVASFALFTVPHDFTALFIAMCLFCFMYNAVMPQFESITLSHLIGKSERYGRIRVWGSIGFVGVVSLFGVLLDHLPVTALPWLMLPLFAAMAISAFFNDYGQAPVAVTESESPSFLGTLRRPEVIAFFIVALLMQISFGPYYTFYSIYLDEHGYRPSVLGIFWSIGVVVEILVFTFSAWIFRRWNAATVLHRVSDCRQPALGDDCDVARQRDPDGFRANPSRTQLRRLLRGEHAVPRAVLPGQAERSRPRHLLRLFLRHRRRIRRPADRTGMESGWWRGCLFARLGDGCGGGAYRVDMDTAGSCTCSELKA